MPCARETTHGKGFLCQLLYAWVVCHVLHMANLLSCVIWPLLCAKVHGKAVHSPVVSIGKESNQKQGLQNRWELVWFDRLSVKPVRSGSGLGRYQTGPNSKFKFEFKKMKNYQKILKILQGATNLMVSNFLKNSFI